LIEHDLFGKPLRTFPDHALVAGDSIRSRTNSLEGPRMVQATIEAGAP
jgi:hypothetical protein